MPSMQNQTDTPRSRFRLTNLHVVAMLLVAGVCLIGVTFMLAKDIGRVPFSIWDICTTPVEPVAMPADEHAGS